jgi:2-polyprenyl-3-methyl-5-hydroxy-6-metoxy-1,4-benzoquinol methylase
MKRTLEKLAKERQEKEADFSRQLESLQEKSKAFSDIQESLRSLPHLSELVNEYLLESTASEEKQGAFLSPAKIRKQFSSQSEFNRKIVSVLKGFQEALEQNLQQTRKLCSSLSQLGELNTSLMDARDREWDALGSNHVAMIFKSMEWRIDRLAAGYEDASLLMKKFTVLKEKLTQLLEQLDKKELPSEVQVREIMQPLEDFSYASFENRYRGTEEEVKKQQEIYLSYFKQDKKILDLGCGRGEFIGLLAQNGIEAQGIDINEQMIDICRNKGYNCHKAGILETLSEQEDNSLGGIFSSQVIEHLNPAYLKRMIEIAYFKLAPDSHIILETLNPASVFSLVQVYFLDISHQQPIHPQTLKFLLESAGFDEVDIKYSSPLEEEKLNSLPGTDEMATSLNQNIDKLNELLYAPTNYAAIGKKAKE